MNCSDERLRILLEKNEDGLGFEETLRHLDNCEYCQSRIEQLAAHKSVWQESQVILASSGALRASGQPDDSGQTPHQAWHRSRWQPHAIAWNESVAQQLLSPPSHPEMLGRIGRYEVERFIGSGGMGVVFKAFDSELHRPVAVKVLAPHLAGNGSARQRFAREARAAAAVVHEHVVAIHNVETDGTAPFLVMEYVAGESLQQRIDRDGALELREVLRIALQTASGLAAAHAQGLVHRDVKPGNILLEKGVDRTLLTDFGLARAVDDASLTHTGYHPGTPQYMSPEQARGETVDARSDLFSLGSVIYTMSTGRPPFRAESSYGVLRRITDNEPRSMREVCPDIPEWLETIVAKLHAKSPDQRFADADEVHKLLEQCLAHIQHPSSVPLPDGCRQKEQSRTSVKGNKRLRSQLTFTLFVACGMVAAAFIGRQLFLSETNLHPKQMTSAPEKIAEPVVETGDVPSAVWDANSEKLQQFDEELNSFELRSRSRWQSEFDPTEK